MKLLSGLNLLLILPRRFENLLPWQDHEVATILSQTAAHGGLSKVQMMMASSLWQAHHYSPGPMYPSGNEPYLNFDIELACHSCPQWTPPAAPPNPRVGPGVAFCLGRSISWGGDERRGGGWRQVHAQGGPREPRLLRHRLIRAAASRRLPECSVGAADIPTLYRLDRTTTGRGSGCGAYRRLAVMKWLIQWDRYSALALLSESLRRPELPSSSTHRMVKSWHDI